MVDLGRDRKTVRAYLSGDRQAGVRVSAVEDGLDRVEPYVRQRLSDDRHVWATVIYDEIGELGSDQSYPTFTRKLRERDLRPRCEACAVVYTAPSGMVVSGISDDGSLVFVGEPLDPTRAAHQESIVLDTGTGLEIGRIPTARYQHFSPDSRMVFELCCGNCGRRRHTCFRRWISAGHPAQLFHQDHRWVGSSRI